jgi:dihydroorotate dehydrogenase
MVLVSNSKDEVGGLSGKPLTKELQKSFVFYRKGNKAFPIIGLASFCETMLLKNYKPVTSLIQLYTGFIYEGRN